MDRPETAFSERREAGSIVGSERTSSGRHGFPNDFLESGFGYDNFLLQGVR